MICKIIQSLISIGGALNWNRLYASDFVPMVWPHPETALNMETMIVTLCCVSSHCDFFQGAGFDAFASFTFSMGMNAEATGLSSRKHGYLQGHGSVD